MGKRKSDKIQTEYNGEEENGGMPWRRGRKIYGIACFSGNC
jgi:hypothetical protein